MAGGVRLTLLLGRAVPVPAPAALVEALDSVEVEHGDGDASGFRLTFHAGRPGGSASIDSAVVASPLLQAFTRVILLVTIGAVPRVLMDGVVTHHTYKPGDARGAGSLTVMGKDVSAMMDLHDVAVEHPGQPEAAIAAKILLSYAQYGVTPLVVPPPSIDVPLPIERTPVQKGTDLSYLREMAARFGYVFCVVPGPIPGQNVAYWGPPIRAGLPQRALRVDMGPDTNVRSVSFAHDALAPELILGSVQDRTTNVTVPVATIASLRVPLASRPDLFVNLPNVRTSRFEASGVSAIQAFARAQGRTDASLDRVATATGELDATRYGDVLMPRSLVGVQGAGFHHDGFWYVKRVSHRIRRGEYAQSFTLSREGLGSLVPAVMP